jgi:peptide/nickel transport system substrate-binding protein
MEWGEKYWPSKPVRGGEYRTASTIYIGMMNPNHWPIRDIPTLIQFYDRLILPSIGSRPTAPWLMESLEYPDSLSAIMKLKQGVHFHDGSKFNAESMQYQIEWIKDKKNGCWSRALLAPLKSVEILDEYTLKFHFQKPWAGFSGIMAVIPGWALSAKALKADAALKDLKRVERKLKLAVKKAEKLKGKAKAASDKGDPKAEKAAGKFQKAQEKVRKLEKECASLRAAAKGAKDFDTNPVGTGPFILEKALPGNYIKLKRNPNWWFGQSIGRPEMPYFDSYRSTVMPDPAIQLANLRAGKLDTLGLQKAQYPIVKNDPNLQIQIFPGSHTTALAFNTQQGPCKDIRVRKAISHAIDRKAIISGVLFGLGREASCIFPGDHWAHNPNLKPVTHDPELSKRLLSEAGYSRGLTIRGHMNNSETSKTLGEAIKAMLSQVGIKWKLDILDPVAASDRRKNIEYDLASSGWVAISDPDIVCTSLYHPDGGRNYGRSNNKKAIELMLSAREEFDEEKRTQMYHELEYELYQNYEDLWLSWDITAVAYRKNVQGWNNEMWKKYGQIMLFSHPLWFKEGHN